MMTEVDNRNTLQTPEPSHNLVLSLQACIHHEHQMGTRTGLKAKRQIGSDRWKLWKMARQNFIRYLS